MTESMTPKRLAEIEEISRRSIGHTTANVGSPDYIAFSNACAQSSALDECIHEIDRLQAQVKSARDAIHEASMNSESRAQEILMQWLKENPA